MALDPAAAALMRDQFGLASRPQLLALGYSEGQIEGLVQRAILVPYHCGTYHLAGSGAPDEQAAMAAALRCRPRARVTGQFVLGLLRVEGFTPRSSFEVLVPPGRRVQNVPFTVRNDPAWDLHRAMWRSLPIVTAARALVDAAHSLPERRVLTAIDSLRWLGLASDARILATAETLRHRGATLVRRLYRSGALVHESQGERSLADVLEGVDPPLEWQVWVMPGRRVDALWRDVSIVLESASRWKHGQEHQRAADVVRDAELEARGYLVLHITQRDLDHPAGLIARLRDIRSRRARELGIAS